MGILAKAAPILTDENFTDILPVAWELMLENDQELAAAAGILCIKFNYYAVWLSTIFKLYPLGQFLLVEETGVHGETRFIKAIIACIWILSVFTMFDVLYILIIF